MLFSIVKNNSHRLDVVSRKKKWKKAAAEQAGTGRLSKKEYKKKKALEAIAAYQRSLQADKQNNIQILRARKEKLR